jgi:hypothetical protein
LQKINISKVSQLKDKEEIFTPLQLQTSNLSSSKNKIAKLSQCLLKYQGMENVVYDEKSFNSIKLLMSSLKDVKKAFEKLFGSF